MKHKHTLILYAIACALVVCSLLTVYGILVIASSAKASPPQPLTVSSAVNCAFPDKTFCSTDALFKGLVGSQDFSDVLENQTPVSITCSTAKQVQAYCSDIKNGLTIDLYKVQQNQQSQLLTRNRYIDYFKSYFEGNGPFLFSGEKSITPNTLMYFDNKTHTKQYTLTFGRSGSKWQLAYPTVTAL
jgi:ribosomal protein L44E